MADGATSSSPLVQAQLDRLSALSGAKDGSGHQRLARQLAALGNPQDTLPPVFHIAGTNGKGSVCAFLRAAVEANGGTAHVFTSPHLVRLNERIRISSALVSDEALAGLLAEALDAAEQAANATASNDDVSDAADADRPTTFFETIAAAALLGFSRAPADAAIIEVGLGGRLDATNIISRPAVCGIAQIGLDHQEYLGDTLPQIAREKAAIAKRGVPLVTMRYEPDVSQAVAEIAHELGALLLAQGEAWDIQQEDDRLIYEDARGALALPAPVLAGSHQVQNAGLAIAILRHQTAMTMSDAAIQKAMLTARWPGRLERLQPGPVTALLPPNAKAWVDGAHNVPAMAAALSHIQNQLSPSEPLHIVIAMLERKDASGVFAVIAREFGDQPCHIYAVPAPTSEGYPPERLAEFASAQGLDAEAYPSLDDALKAITTSDAKVLMTGTLYLAGQILAANAQAPD